MFDVPVVLTRYGDPVRAELVRDRLVEVGIAAHLGNFEASTTLGVTASNGIEVLVPKHDLEQATALLAQIERESTDPARIAALELEAMTTPKPPEATEG